MTLLRAFDLTLSFGSRTLFSNLELVIEEGERVGLVGVNGCGKSTLMKVLTGEVKPDTGTMQVQRGMRVSHLAQEPDFTPGATPSSELSVAQQALRDALDEHARLSASLETTYDERVLERLSVLVETIEHLGGWDTAHESRKLLDRLGVDPVSWDQPIELLSGGQKKRVAIARALLTHADLLMLDEPSLGLAPLIVRDIFRVIAGLREIGVSILLVEQNARAALQVADYGYVLETGEIVLEGPSAELASNPRVIESYLGLVSGKTA